MKLIVLFALVAVAYADCPNYPPWRDWTDNCLWFPLRKLREDMMTACNIGINLDDIPTLPDFEGLPPEPCGHCSMKVRCRTRDPQGDRNCFPMELEKQICHEHGDVCQFPKLTMKNLGCNYRLIKPYFKQCMGRPELTDEERQGFKKLNNLLEDMNCVEKDGQCKCCCHPYKPSPDGQSCVEQTPPQCEPWSDWSDSTECLWFPLENIRKTVMEKCAVDTWKPSEKHKSLLSKLQLPGGVELPNRCGYCSFKVKCKRRPMQDADGKKKCFPVKAEKTACGEDDCPTCHEVCEMPKVLDSCDYSETMRKVLGPKVKAVLKKLPYHMQHGLADMLGVLPHSNCVEKEGKCKCCCHPYKPNAEGTACEINPICKTIHEHGIDVKWNKDAGDAFWFL